MFAPTLRGTPRILRAFTLIELLVVVAVIVVLMAVLFPALSRVRERTRTATCLANMKKIGVALHLYIQDNRDYAPPRAVAPAVHSRIQFPGYHPENDAATWADQIFLGHYLGSTNGDNKKPEFKYASVKARSPLICPSDRFHEKGDVATTSYGMGTNFVQLNDKAHYSRLWKAVTVKEPSLEMAVVDASLYVVAPGGWTEPYPFHGVSDDVPAEERTYSDGPLSRYNWAKRHNGGGANVLFVDGSARFIEDLKTAYDNKELKIHVPPY